MQMAFNHIQAYMGAVIGFPGDFSQFGLCLAPLDPLSNCLLQIANEGHVHERTLIIQATIALINASHRHLTLTASNALSSEH